MKVEGLQGGIVFGPIASRRLGRSLGINLLPPTAKTCSFNCPYCECGPSTPPEAASTAASGAFPSVEAVANEVEIALKRFAEDGASVDAITLAGNGEPTLHPEFPAVMEALASARDRRAPAARLVVLTNATTLGSESIRDALMIADEREIKLDAPDDETLRRINNPNCLLSVDDIVADMKRLPAFTLQTMFIDGAVTNAEDRTVNKWIERVRDLSPSRVRIYSVERVPADASVKPVPAERLREIAARLSQQCDSPVYTYT